VNRRSRGFLLTISLWLLLYGLTPAAGATIEFRAVPDGVHLPEIPLGLPVFVVVDMGAEPAFPPLARAFVTVHETRAGLMLSLEPMGSLYVGGPMVLGETSPPESAFAQLAAAAGDLVVVLSPLVSGGGASSSVTCRAVGFSTPACLPGHSFTAELRLFRPDTSADSILTAHIPSDWGVSSAHLQPLGSHAFRWLSGGEPGGVESLQLAIDVPGDAKEGLHELRFTVQAGKTGEMIALSTWLVVQSVLTPYVVMTHWDVGTHRVDLSSPGRLTYERIRWAASRIGTVLPHTGEILRAGSVEDWTADWQAGVDEMCSQPVPFTLSGHSTWRSPSLVGAQASEDIPQPISSTSSSAIAGDAPVPVAGTAGTESRPEEAGNNIDASFHQMPEQVLGYWSFAKSDVICPIETIRTKFESLTWIEAGAGQAVSLSEAGACLTASGIAPVDLAGGITLLAWIRPGATLDNRRSFVSIHDSPSTEAASPALILYSDWIDGRPALILDNGARRVGFVADLAIARDDAWHHLVVVVGGGVVEFFIDGACAGSGGTRLRFVMETPLLEIGSCNKINHESGANADGFAGDIFDLGLLGMGLPAEEIDALAGAGP
jgi:hypothetical protein